MITSIRKRLSYANVTATIALVAACSGAAVAATHLPRHSVGKRQLRARAVTASKIAPRAVRAGKLAPGAVTANRIRNGAVTDAKLDRRVGPFVGTLRSGQTLPGAFGFTGEEPRPESDFFSFPFPLQTSPKIGGTDHCHGMGQDEAPSADPGYLCVYTTSRVGHVGTPAVFGVSRFGFGLRVDAEPGPYVILGSWAVTAP